MPTSGGVEDGLILAISGPVGAGKTTLAEGLAQSVPATVVSTRDVLRLYAEADHRLTLQQLGERLDDTEGGAWVARPVLSLRSDTPPATLLVVDAVRTRDQLNALGLENAVAHVHLTASDDVLTQRYKVRRARNSTTEFSSFDEARANATEAAVDQLAVGADAVLDTGTTDIDATRVAVLRYLQSRI